MSESVSYYVGCYYVGCPVIEMLYNSDHPIAKQIAKIHDLLGSKYYEKKYETIFTELKSLKSDITFNDAITIGDDSISRNLINWETEYVPNNDTSLEDAITNLATDLTKICKGHSEYSQDWYLYTTQLRSAIDTYSSSRGNEDDLLLPPHVWRATSFEELLSILHDYQNSDSYLTYELCFNTLNLSQGNGYFFGTDDVSATKNNKSDSYTITEINSVPTSVYVFNILEIAIICETVGENFIKLQTIAKTTTNEKLISIIDNLQPHINYFLNLSVTFENTTNYTITIKQMLTDIINLNQSVMAKYQQYENNLEYGEHFG